MTLTREELDMIINWYYVAEFEGQTNDDDDVLVEKLRQESLGN